MIILAIFFLTPSYAADELTGALQSELSKSTTNFNKVGKETQQRSCPGDAPIYRSSASAAWHPVPTKFAQCTPGAASQGHSAKVRIATYTKDYQFSIEQLSSPTIGAVSSARKTHPNAKYIGNGPIYMTTGEPNGYVKSNGKVISSIDCVNFRTNSGNLGHENSIFVRYHPRKSPEWKYRVVSTEFLCNQLQPQPYVRWLESKGTSDVQSTLKRNKKWETDGEDLVEGGQIDFAIQSGPAVLRGGQNVLSGYNSATSNRSYIGINNSGQPVVVEADGNIGSYCLGQYLKSQGLRDLLHRDSFISEASFREDDGSTSGYPVKNSNAKAASLLIISP